MTDIQTGMVGIGILVVLIGLRLPIAISLIVVSFAGIWQMLGFKIAWNALGIMPYGMAASWVLSSVPMFLLMGYICYHAQLTKGLFNAARLLMRSIPGGMAVAAILGTSGFAAVCGSSVACSAAMGRIAIPEMMRAGYHPQLAAGTVAVAGTIGALIPPSIILILYGVIAQVSISQLFLGGISAGLLTAAGYIVVVMIRVYLKPELAPKDPHGPAPGERMAALKETWPILVIMVGIFGGMFSGVFTATEAGAVGAFLASLVAGLRGSLNWHRFSRAVIETLMTTSTLILIAVGASLFTRFLTLSGAGDSISTAIISTDASVAVLLFGIAVVYLLMGLFLEPVGAMLLTLPIVLPIVEGAGLSLIWFGVVLTKLLEIGMVTPPIGMNVFVIKGVVGKLITLTDIFKGVMWFIVMDLFVVAFLMAFPGFILTLAEMAK
ncbi:TRAP transporter large permease subunit [Paracoccus sp. YIM 132242]|uniref:TRAP transporter large permease protein n=1 Tax=Paracoccus lichenicola TaxID=2665644 RepID=A0A6L6HPI2_9RHOB|nr:TRAP transporter large permease [Paracoccus lichenicola]MTE00292.1 TRAP transporter large permease subunit [Paracoccus lichenicola]